MAVGDSLLPTFCSPCSDCYVCKSLYPKIRSIAAQHPDVQWVKLNGSDPVLVDLFRAMGVTKVRRPFTCVSTWVPTCPVLW